MPRTRRRGAIVVPQSFSGLCKLCWKRADKRDRTINGYHIECAKEANEIMMNLLHSKRGIVYETWYRSRYPNRPVPGASPARRPSSAKG